METLANSKIPVFPSGILLPAKVSVCPDGPNLFKNKYRDAYRLKNPEKIKVHRKRWYEKYKKRENEKRDARRKIQISKDPLIYRQKERERWNKYFIANKEKVIARKKEWDKNNQVHRQTYNKLWKTALRKEFLLEYGEKCTCCGIIDKEFLTLEHINRDGAKHRKEVGRNSAQVLRDIKKRGWPKEAYTILCMNCNFATRLGAICPHKSKEK